MTREQFAVLKSGDTVYNKLKQCYWTVRRLEEIYGQSAVQLERVTTTTVFEHFASDIEKC